MSAFLSAGIMAWLIGWPLVKIGGGFKVIGWFVQMCGGLCLLIWAFAFFIMGTI